MGHHIVYKDGKVHFQSDLHPELPLDKIILSFNDKDAWPALWKLAETSRDPELAKDIRFVLAEKESDAGPDISTAP